MASMKIPVDHKDSDSGRSDEEKIVGAAPGRAVANNELEGNPEIPEDPDQGLSEAERAKIVSPLSLLQAKDKHSRAMARDMKKQ